MVILLTACSESGHQNGTAMPKDGVHVSGANQFVYPVSSAGSCVVNSNGAIRFLAYSDEVAIGEPTLNFVVAPYTGPDRYDKFGTEVPIPTRLWVGLRTSKQWIAASGVITVDRVEGGRASGTVQAHALREINDHSNVDAIGSWACHVTDMLASPSPSLPSSPVPVITPSPLPAGTPVARQVLAPATVLPAVDLCTSPVQKLQDGNAWPIFCQGGKINVAAWDYFVQLHPQVMSLGPTATLDTIQAAVCADIAERHLTQPQEDSIYALAWQYYGSWPHGFDPTAFIIGGGCR